ncbi:ATP-grasp ribosomal peptide maturase [Amycolatopsis sp. BJA-103]|uniref:ATP-grasp ribosomal peptide maturase n=1 Tax=Amycolatopsis sp. BJA-103 TaxID=1911175 RepID=UPI000C780384|nr:ATP-grasp ribosomal peptide maturase [Amycolatopsis sp. BJA-103]AUI58444.1 glutathione synthase/ribosomal protein S6 modification enzyme (glutaminyl transferase) [Amycolatopsis sp. BJA-103]PNE15122.1 glutathione synthase/ribosomal protein S6 modification enzyme (glutaminyl transferase) [Amycolatopsis sp. BJA-103]
MTVLILAQEADAPTDALVAELIRRDVAVFRADTSWFPRRLVLDAELTGGHWIGTLTTAYRSVQLGDIRAIWYRDPAAFAFPPELTEVERAYAHREARLGFGGVLAALSDVLWANNPNRAADSMYKPLQLTTAAACGLHVLPTLVTNSPDAVRRFAGKLPGGVVHKSFGPNTIAEGGQLKVAYTRRFATADIDDLRGVGSTALQAQAWVDKGSEARVVVIGERMFTILITATSAAAHVDWRADFGALTYELIDTPPDVEAGVRAYMKALGLAYAALDFGIEKDTGRLVFYESNSSGQYGWLEAQTGAPITAALADLLAGACS